MPRCSEQFSLLENAMRLGKAVVPNLLLDGCRREAVRLCRARWTPAQAAMWAQPGPSWTMTPARLSLPALQLSLLQVGKAPLAAAACRPLASQTELSSVTHYQKIPNSGCDASVNRVDHTCQLLRGVALALPQRHKCQPLSLILQ